MLLIIALLVFTLAIAAPLWWFARGERRLTWSSAVLLAIHISVVATLLIAEIPSRLLYWFDAEHVAIAEKYPITEKLMLGDEYIIVRDIVVNTIQGTFFVAIFALAYLWGERQRKAGRFKT